MVQNVKDTEYYTIKSFVSCHSVLVTAANVISFFFFLLEIVCMYRSAVETFFFFTPSLFTQ